VAVLRAKTGIGIELTLKPYRVSEKGDPTWILVSLEFRHERAALLATTLVVTTDDLAQIRADLDQVAAGQRDECSVTTSDDDLVFYAQGLGLPGDVAIGFWTGEPYGLMKGFRFVASGDALTRFTENLGAEELAVTWAARPP
jgi:hypothetical protein